MSDWFAASHRRTILTMYSEPLGEVEVPEALYWKSNAVGTSGQLTPADAAVVADVIVPDPNTTVGLPASVIQSTSHLNCNTPAGTNDLFEDGHNSFTLAEDGVTDLPVYHARTYTEIVGDPLWDPNRHTYVKPLKWDDQNMPVFGRPSDDGFGNT